MSKFRPTTADTVAGDLAEFAHWITFHSHPTDDELRAELAKWLNRKLDQLLAQDAFGTEGQQDPRGDHRE